MRSRPKSVPTPTGQPQLSRPLAVAQAAVWLSIVAVATWLSWLSLQKASIHDWFTSDLGNMWETVWRVAHGAGFSFTYQGELVSRLAFHADYILLLLAPLGWISRGPTPLLIVQALTVTAGAWFVWSITRRWIHHEGLALIMAGGWLVYGPMLFPVLWQFHAVTLAPTFMLAMAEAIIARRRTWVFWLWFGLAAITKEQTGLVAGLFALLFSWRWGDRRRGWLAFGVGSLATLLNFLVFIPAWRVERSHFVWKYYYGDLGSSTREQLLALLSPAVWWQRIQRLPLVSNLVLLLVPLGCLPLLNWWWLIGVLVVLPAWFAQFPEAQSVFHQNHVLTIPFLFIGTIQGIEQLLRREHTQAKMALGMMVGLGMVMFICAGLFTPFPWSVGWNPAWLTRDSVWQKMESVAPTIPTSASVAYTLGLPVIYRTFDRAVMLPQAAGQAEYYAVFAIPEFESEERVGGLQWRLFNRRMVDYLAASSDVRPLYQSAAAGLYQKKPGTNSAQLDRDIQALFTRAIEDARIIHQPR